MNTLKNLLKVNQNFNLTFKKFISNHAKSHPRMKAIMQTGIGGYETFYIGETERPIPREGEVLMKV